MKKSVMLTVLGLGLAASSTFGQGGIIFDNSLPTSPGSGIYNPIVWDPLLGGEGVKSTDGVIVTIYYGEGILDASALTAGPTVVWNTEFEAAGFFGYYTQSPVALPDFQPGDVYTFQLRASGDSIFGPVDEARSVSELWQESTSIVDVSSFPPLPFGQSLNRIGFTVYVPEPSTFALAGLGSAAMLIFRRRRS